MPNKAKICVIWSIHIAKAKVIPGEVAHDRDPAHPEQPWENLIHI